MVAEKRFCAAGSWKKRIALWVSICACAGVCILPASAAESSEENRQTVPQTLIPMGKAVGIKLFSDGLLVVNLSESTDGEGNPSPAKSCGIRMGDLILEMNHENLKSTEQLQKALQENGDQSVSLTVKRGSKLLSFSTTPVSGEDGVYRLGAWVRDSMAGIGTLTYYDPQTGMFGALGHGITDTDTTKLMPAASGSLMPASVAGVKKAASGAPGELTGDFKPDIDIGILHCNSNEGVFGVLTDQSLVSGTELPIAKSNEVRCGEATILSNVNGDEVEEYTVRITKILKSSDGGRDMMLRITDKRLLDRTGGIVQGMSGSPIIQNGKLVGAVTHVLVNDPTRGYGIFIENMLEAAD